LALKIYYSREIVSFNLDRGLIFAIGIASIVFGGLMYLFTLYYPFPIDKGEIVQALNIILVGVIGLFVYGGVTYAISKNVRGLVKAAMKNLVLLAKSH
jgi:hypothetical protein